MKAKFFVALSALVLMTASAAFAQNTNPMQADIPFAFRAGNHSFPAGHYEIKPELSPGVVMIRCTDTGEVAVIIANRAHSVETVENATLVFNRYGNRYYLAKLWRPGYNAGSEFRKSKAEQESAKLEPASAVTVAARVR
jgi:hypothetical protein